MKGMWKKTGKLALIGMLIGILVGLFFILILKMPPESFMFFKGKAAAAAYLVYCAVYGAVANGSQIIYSIEEWGITRVTVTHFLIVLTGFYILGFSLGWLSVKLPEFWIMTGLFVAAYVIIWLCFYFSYKKKIRELNDGLEKWKSGHPDE